MGGLWASKRKHARRSMRLGTCFAAPIRTKMKSVSCEDQHIVISIRLSQFETMLWESAKPPLIEIVPTQVPTTTTSLCTIRSKDKCDYSKVIMHQKITSKLFTQINGRGHSADYYLLPLNCSVDAYLNMRSIIQNCHQFEYLKTNIQWLCMHWIRQTIDPL